MLLPALLVPPRLSRPDTRYCVPSLAAICSCASAGIAKAPQAVNKRMRGIWLILRVVNCVIIGLSPLLSFHDPTVGTRPESSPEPLRRFGTGHFSSTFVPTGQALRDRRLPGVLPVKPPLWPDRLLNSILN